MFRPFSFLWLLPLAVSSLIHAQDGRTVLEPFFPPSCGSVDAGLQITDDAMVPAGGQAPDTARIQKAIDRCGKGRALVLRVDQEKNAFVTGPLILKPDITLILSRGVTLYAARDPRQYDVTPGSCDGHNGCKPLISVEHASGDGIMGDGVIDGGGVAARLVSVDNSDNFTLYRVTLRNSAGLNFEFDHGNRLTLWGVRVKETGADKGSGISIGSGARNVTITQSYVEHGAEQTEIVAGGTGQAAH